MNRENSMLEGSQLSIFFGASKYSSEKTDGNSDEKCWSCWDSGFAFNVLSSKQMSLGKSGWVLAIITLPASHWESTSSTVLLKKIRTSELQDPWIHVSNANVEVPSFRHLSLVGVLPWYKPNINAQRRKRFLSFSITFVSMFRQIKVPISNASPQLPTGHVLWQQLPAPGLWQWKSCGPIACGTKILAIAMTGFTNWHLWQNVAWICMNDLNDHFIMRLHHGGGPHTKWSKCTQHRASIRCRCGFHEALELSWIIWHLGWNHVFIVT